MAWGEGEGVSELLEMCGYLGCGCDWCEIWILGVWLGMWVGVLGKYRMTEMYSRKIFHELVGCTSFFRKWMVFYDAKNYGVKAISNSTEQSGSEGGGGLGCLSFFNPAVHLFFHSFPPYLSLPPPLLSL